MKHEVFQIKENGSLDGTQLYTYILDSSPELVIERRPLILICPGGAYFFTSDREAESTAVQFMAMGYHAAVLRYSCAPATYPTQLSEVARSFAIIREHAEEWNVDADKIILQGCSAGGHLAGHYATIWNQGFLSGETGIRSEMLRPNGLILNYPVISSKKYPHQASFQNLLGERYEELLESVSLEDKVNQDVPRTFLWHTFEDEDVAVENSLLFVNALRKQNIETEFHMYAKGRHGLGLANELTAGTDGFGI